MNIHTNNFRFRDTLEKFLKDNSQIAAHEAKIHIGGKPRRLAKKVAQLQLKCAQIIEELAQISASSGGATSNADTAPLRAKWKALSKKLRRSYRFLAAFREHHGLAREARFPNVEENAALLAALGALESVVNAGFFLDSHMARGLLSALSISSLISLTNVSLSAVSGVLFGRELNFGKDARYPNAKEFRGRRRRAQLFVGFFIAAAGYVHLTAGLIRSQQRMEHLDYSGEAILNAVTTPESLFLMIFGACLSVFTFYKARSAFADPYPEYGEKQVDIDATIDEAEEIFSDAEERINDEHDAAAESVAKAQKSYLKTVRQAEKSLVHLGDAIAELDATLTEADEELKAAIAEIVADQLAVPGRRPILDPEKLPEELSSISIGLPPHWREIPVLPPRPDFDQRLSDIESSRSVALEDLGAAFEATFTSEVSEESEVKE